MKKDLVAVILAGGEGKRFWPLSTSKVLFPFFGKPLIEYSVKQVMPKEVIRIIVVTNSNNDEAVRRFQFAVPHMSVIQKQPHGMADALLSAEGKLNDCSLLVINGDDVYDRSVYTSVIRLAEKTGAFGVIPGWKTEKHMPLGYLALDGNRIKEIVEKPDQGKEPSQYVELLGHYISDSNLLFVELRKTRSDQDDVYERALSILMKENRFEMHVHNGGFAGLKYPWHVLDVMGELFKRMKPHQSNNVDVRSSVTIEGSVFIEDNVKIFEHSKIVGPAYIGRDTIIGNNTIIRQSHIGSGCVIGFNSDITRSYIGDNCWLHSNYIGDSVLEGDISMGAGSVLANLRLDEGEISSDARGERVKTHRTKLGAIIGRNVRIGVNTSIMPGVKIGSGSFVGAGVILDKDLPDGKFCIGKSDYSVLDNTKKPGLHNRNEFRNTFS